MNLEEKIRDNENKRREMESWNWLIDIETSPQ